MSLGGKVGELPHVLLMVSLLGDQVVLAGTGGSPVSSGPNGVLK